MTTQHDPGEMSLGEKRVRATFNPLSDSLVDSIKHRSAELINIVEGLKQSFATDANSTPEFRSEGIRLCALAQTAYEEAAMWAVKAATSGR